MTLLSHLPSIKETIIQYELMAKKSLGQNFLLNMEIVRKVARSARSLKTVTVIEIGPGPGGLTRALIEAGAEKIIAIEHDPRCIEALQELITASQNRLTVIQADALSIKPQELAAGPVKIVANLPYNIGTQLLINWLHDLQNIQSMTLMFQKEVALRIIAKPRTSQYGRLSVLCQYLTAVSKEFDLPPGAFSPAPKIMSSVVHFSPKNLSPIELELVPYIEKITHAAFGQRRKMIRSSLSSVFSQEQLIATGIKPTARAEELSIENYIALAKMLKAVPNTH